MNPVRRALVLAAFSALAAPPLATAHSIEDLQQDLHEREQYFQPKNEPAPAFALEDAEGNPVALEDLRGKAVVLYFIYAGCTDVCPLHSAKIADAQDAVNATPTKDRVQFIAITTDPASDVPDVLRGHREAQDLEPHNWTFLTSGSARAEDTTRRLAEAFGHGVTVTDDGHQMHGIVTHVIDRRAHGAPTSTGSASRRPTSSSTSTPS